MMNHFELFEMPISLNPDFNYINKKYLELQKKYHPDYFTLHTDDEQTVALQKSAQINQAIKTLKNQDNIIEYVLQLKGLLQEEEKYNLPAAFLMQMMELNEALIEGNDNGTIAKKANEIETSFYKEILHIINNYDDKKTALADLLKLKEYYFKKKYVRRILDRING
jgi:molecular chaperone HscB